jgi:adenosine deaminase CECR1
VDPNRPVMTVADSPKKRKRALSPHPTRKLPIHTEETKDMDSATEEKIKKEGTVPRSTFNTALGDVKKLNKYDEERKQVLQREEQNAWDREAKAGSNPTEKRAALIIGAIREHERIHIFGNLPSEALPESWTQDMGGQFLTNKERIDTESRLYEIAKMVPKGALLHLHFNAELHPELLLVKARETKNMYIRSIRRLETQSDLDLTEMVFNVLDPTTVKADVNIFVDPYPKDASKFKSDELKDIIWMPWSKFQDEFEQRFGQKYKQEEPDTFREGRPQPHNCGDHVQTKLRPAENWLRSKMVLSKEEAYGFTQTVNG